MTQIPEPSFDPAAPRGFPSAAVTFAGWQRLELPGLAIGLLLALVIDWRAVLLIANVSFTLFYLITTLYRILVINRALGHDCEIHQDNAATQPPPPGGWPKYLVLVPLYKEAAILPHLVGGLCRLNYPVDRLEIRLLIEADDTATMSAAQNMELPVHVRIWPIPVSLPRTKPKACNVGLADSDAELLVIFDAEDRPEPDQLKKAALAFAELPAKVACLQGKLNFYNQDHNLLTRCFTIDYTTWFDLCLPGLDSLKAPIPLGGTSNHFRLSVLRELGGWDEYNVTEDCDLGMRLYATGHETRILASTTWEQACSHTPSWIKQRSRWVKGYLQTYLVHTRRPFSMIRELGCWRTAQFHLLVGGSVFAQLLNPIYWGLALLWFFIRPDLFKPFFPPAVFAMGAFCLFVGNFVFVYTAGLACVKRRFGSTAKYSLLMPFYWVLMTFGAWKGVIQLLYAPHHWEKTQHHEVIPPGNQGGTP
jgi:cellulose synthase/poly-beta-1,6-N-acetylglucosamine synthase-like glycosyltransferase